MTHLSSVRTNILYAKKTKENDKEPDEYLRFHELIFLLDKPAYRYSNELDVIRERTLEEVRITVSDKNFDKMIEILKKLKDADESELS